LNPQPKLLGELKSCNHSDLLIYSRGNSVNRGKGYGLNARRSIPGGGRYFSLCLHCVEIDSEAYPVGTRCSFAGSKAADA